MTAVDEPSISTMGSDMTRNHETAHTACPAGLLSLTLLLGGCGAHVDLQRLAQTPDELQALYQFKLDHPDASSSEDLSMALEAYRAANLRKRALAIQFRHRYPNATSEEVTILVDDQMAREGPYPAAAPMDCTNNSSASPSNTIPN